MPRASRLICLAAVLVALVSPARGAERGLLVTVGEVTDTSAVVWVRGIAWGEVSVRYEGASSGAAGRSARKEIRVGPSHHLTGKIVLEPLEPGTRYRYTVAQNQTEVTGEFVTAPAPGTAAPVRFT